MPPVTAENFQERVLAQRAVVEEQGRETAMYCTACSKRFSTFNAYENHLKSKRHVEFERRAAEAASRKVQMLNEKNLEKGMEQENLDKDATNMAIQQAIKAQPSMSPKKQPLVSCLSKPSIPTTDLSQVSQRDGLQTPPRLQWFKEQANKLSVLEAKEESEEDMDQGDDWEDVDSEDEEDFADDELEGTAKETSGGAVAESTTSPGALPVTDCLFCSHHSRSLMKNMAHMSKAHSFFIPDIEYLQDLRGLIKYLGEKVGVGKICLWCNEKGKSFYSTEAVQAHMNDKSHCKLYTDGDAALEFADFYDFRASYPDHKAGDDVDMHEKLSAGEKNVEYDDESMELILPSGARIGHRSLMRYYKQRFGLQRAVVVSKNQRVVGRVLQQYRALGWTSGTGSLLTQERDMQYIQRMKSKWMLKTGMSNNATKQMHFRPQVRF